MTAQYDRYGMIIGSGWSLQHGTDVGGVVVVLGDGVLDLGMMGLSFVKWWLRGFLDWCSLSEAEVSCKEVG